MTISRDEQLEKLRKAGRVVARILAAMGEKLEPGMTTRELDGFGRALLEAEGARPAPEITYGFPGATCISVFPQIAHGVPGDRELAPGDLVNIDVSAELDGYFADTGASFVIPPVPQRLRRLCRDGRRALWSGIKAVRAGARLAEIGDAVEDFARRGRYTLIRNLASHGVGGALREDPATIPTWRDPGERRTIRRGAVFTIEPFLSLGSAWAVEADDGWTLLADSGRPTVQYEHTLVATDRGALVMTLPT